MEPVEVRYATRWWRTLGIVRLKVRKDKDGFICLSPRALNQRFYYSDTFETEALARMRVAKLRKKAIASLEYQLKKLKRMAVRVI